MAHQPPPKPTAFLVKQENDSALEELFKDSPEIEVNRECSSKEPAVLETLVEISWLKCKVHSVGHKSSTDHEVWGYANIVLESEHGDKYDERHMQSSGSSDSWSYFPGGEELRESLEQGQGPERCVRFRMKSSNGWGGAGSVTMVFQEGKARSGTKSANKT